MPTNEKQSEVKNNRENQKQKSIKWQEVENAKNDIQKTFGMTPNFVNNFSERALPGAWYEAKQLRFSDNTTLDPKLKSLICLSVGAQIPCDMISYFEKKSAETTGISIQEQSEAVMMASILRHWSTIINGALINKEEFKKEVDKVMVNVKKMMEEMKGNLPDEKMFLVMPKSADETYKDIEKTLGLVPKFFKVFPKDSIAAAWSEFKGLQFNPHSYLSGKEKELIGLAVAAQIPCEYCTYFHREAAKLNGASEIEMQEAISLAAITRHWSTVFHSPINNQSTFKQDAEKMIESTLRHTIH